MLGDKNVHAVVATKDLEAAKNFYEGTLGLQQIGQESEGVMYKSGDSKLLVYKSQFAGTNQATSASWEVEADALAGVVEQLKAKGVSFEHYEMPGITYEGDVHVMGDMKAAWFKDPDGNILCVGTPKP